MHPKSFTLYLRRVEPSTHGHKIEPKIMLSFVVNLAINCIKEFCKYRKNLSPQLKKIPNFIGCNFISNLRYVRERKRDCNKVLL